MMSVPSFDSSSPKVTKLYTLIIVKKENQILLGFKKRGFGLDKWNGFGGKVEEGESIMNCAIRELKEECGLTAKKLCKHGILWFENLETPTRIDEVHLFSTSEFEGTVIESEEMRPKWFSVSEIPFQNMWPSNVHWLPLLLEGKKFDALFLYCNDELLQIKIKEY